MDGRCFHCDSREHDTAYCAKIMTEARKFESSKRSLPAELTLRDMQEQSHAYARGNGFWDPETNPTVEGKLMLVVSELVEALEEHRSGKDLYYERDGKPEGLAVELADAIIRIGDLAEHLGADLTEAVTKKHAYNLTRPFRHGKKF